jgi:cytoskeleton protein RodZ
MSDRNVESMQSLADQLSHEREEKGVSLNDIADSTKINIRFLQAIEQGDFGCIEPPYVKLFLKAYCRGIGIDPTPVLERYDRIKRAEEEPAVPKKPEPVSAPPPPSEERAAGVLMSNKVIAALAAALAVLIIVGVWLFGPEQAQQPDMDASPLPEAAAPISEVVDSAATEAQGLSEETPQEPVAGPPVGAAKPDSLLLEGTAIEETWYRVEADRQHLYIGTLMEGERAGWKAGAMLLVTFGKPRGIDLVLDGQDIIEDWGPEGTLHLRVTREGLEVLPYSLIQTRADTASTAGEE